MRELRSETRFEGKIFSVEVRHYADAEGEEYERQVAVHPGAVAIVAHDERFLYLVSQPREAVGEEAVLEIPAGTMDVAGESELECARRELDEEIGMRAERWEELRAFFPSPGWAQETTTIFLATELSPSDGEPDADERIEVVRWPLEQLDRAIAEVRDAKTLIGLLLLRERLLA
jgi:ADP-ribose pyrophosphatase